MAAKPPLNIEELRRGGLVKLREKDMFSVWVKTSCCNMNSAQLRKLASITQQYGRGFLLFTTRQIPIIPFIHIDDAEAVRQELSQVYLELDRCGSRVRNINVCYDARLCPDAVADSLSLGEKLENFFRDPILHKIKIGISGCNRDCTFSRVLNDISFVAERSGQVTGYHAYLGGRLGVNPFVGIRVAEFLTEDQAVKLAQNYFDLLRAAGKSGERSADVIARLGADKVKTRLNEGLDRRVPQELVPCQIRVPDIPSDWTTVAVRATCGEVPAERLVKIADLADRYGQGFVHFAVRGAPEIPCVRRGDVGRLKAELKAAGMETVDEGFENIQSCFGNYCAEGLVDPQNMLRRLEKRVVELGLAKSGITLSGSGCPNSCGIAHLSELGFHGVLEPDVDAPTCTGCGLCAAICKRKSIKIEADVAKIDKATCASCGACAAACPTGSIFEKRRGFAVLVGGRGGKEPRLGRTVAKFLTDEEAYEFADRYLKLIKERNSHAAGSAGELGEAELAGLLPRRK